MQYDDIIIGAGSSGAVLAGFSIGAENWKATAFGATIIPALSAFKGGTSLECADASTLLIFAGRRRSMRSDGAKQEQESPAVPA